MIVLLMVVLLALGTTPALAADEGGSTEKVELEVPQFVERALEYLENRFGGVWYSPESLTISVAVVNPEPQDYAELDRNLPDGGSLRIVAARYSESDLLHFLRRSEQLVEESDYADSLRAAGVSVESNKIIVELEGHPDELVTSLNETIPDDALQLNLYSELAGRSLSRSSGSNVISLLVLAALTIIVTLVVVLRTSSPSLTRWGGAKMP
jgi:hypothetical protein